MSKKTATISIIIFIFLIAGGFLAFYFYTNQGGGNNIAPGERPNNLFPPTEGTGGTGSSSSTENETPDPGPGQGGTRTLLKELSTRPVAGAGYIATTSRETSVHIVERATGNVYKVSPENSEEVRVTNTTIPKIAEAVFNKDASRFITRHVKDGEIDTIQSYYAQIIPPETAQTESSIKGQYLTESIKMLVTNPDQNKLFYLVTHSGGSTGVISEFDGTKKTQVFDSPLSEWLPQWGSASTIALTTKPSATAPGFMFLLNTKNAVLTRAISGIKGLTTLINPTGSSVLYSESTQTGILLKIYSFKTSATIDASVQTLPEKCLWSKVDPNVIYCAVPYYFPENSYPDAWYQGRVSFADDIWKIDATTGSGELVIRLKNFARKDIDATNLFMNTKEEYLFFTDKNNFHVWSLRLVP